MAILSKLHRSGIVTGYIDSYCLVCNTHLKCEKDAFSHISVGTHLKNLETTSYVPKYKDDYIRKIKKVYFCECCNLTISTLAKVGLHAKDSTHVSNKASIILQREGSTIIAFENIVISEKAWNGIIDDTCNICNEEFENAEMHKTEETHMMNLVQSKIEFDDDKNVFRKIDEQTLQCLTCNEVLDVTSLNTHCEAASHKKMYADCKNTDVLNDKKPKTAATGQPLFKSGFLNMGNNTKKPTAASKSTDKISTSEPNQTDQNINSTKGTNIFVDIDTELCKILNAENYVTDDETGQKWCILCDWTMNLNGVPVHLASKHHEIMLKLHKKRLDKKSKEFARDDSKFKQETKPQTVKTENFDESALILDSLERYQKSDIKINFVNNAASCRKCNQSVDFNHNTIDNHIQQHKKKDLEDFIQVKLGAENGSVNIKKDNTVNTRKDQSKDRMAREKEFKIKNKTEANASVEKQINTKPVQPIIKAKPINKAAEQFAKDNDLEISGPTTALCMVCNTTVPLTVKNMEEHLKGFNHRSRLTANDKPKNKPILKRTPYAEFVKYVCVCEVGPFKDFVVNRKYAISAFSFITIIKLTNCDFLCYVCDKEFTGNEFDQHINSKFHRDAMEKSMIISSMEREFIRELRPDVYHCGYCNSITSDLEEMEDHCLTFGHLETARSARWRLSDYLPMCAGNQQTVNDIFEVVKRAFC